MPVSAFRFAPSPDTALQIETPRSAAIAPAFKNAFEENLFGSLYSYSQNSAINQTGLSGDIDYNDREAVRRKLERSIHNRYRSVSESAVDAEIDRIAGLRESGLVITKDSQERLIRNNPNLSTMSAKNDMDRALFFHLANEHEARNKRNKIIAAADSTPMTLIGSLAGGMADPVGLGLNALPIVGQSRYLKSLKAAKSSLSRAAVRARYGFIDGVTITAATEPLVAMAAHADQREYDAMDMVYSSLMGGMFSGLFHAALRFDPAVNDLVENYRMRREQVQNKLEGVGHVSAQDFYAAQRNMDPAHVEYIQDATHVIATGVAEGRVPMLDLITGDRLAELAGRNIQGSLQREIDIKYAGEKRVELEQSGVLLQDYTDSVAEAAMSARIDDRVRAIRDQATADITADQIINSDLVPKKIRDKMQAMPADKANAFAKQYIDDVAQAIETRQVSTQALLGPNGGKSAADMAKMRQLYDEVIEPAVSKSADARETRFRKKLDQIKLYNETYNSKENLLSYEKHVHDRIDANIQKGEKAVIDENARSLDDVQTIDDQTVMANGMVTDAIEVERLQRIAQSYKAVEADADAIIADITACAMKGML